MEIIWHELSQTNIFNSSILLKHLAFCSASIVFELLCNFVVVIESCLGFPVGKDVPGILDDVHNNTVCGDEEF